MTTGFTIPVGECTQCGRKIREGEEAQVIVLAGSAWEPQTFTADGRQVAVLEEGAELYRIRVLCPDCQAKEEEE